MLKFNGKALDRMIRERGLNAETVGKLTRIPASRVEAYINGTMKPSCKSLVKLAWVCMCGVEAFFTAGPAPDRLMAMGRRLKTMGRRQPTPVAAGHDDGNTEEG